MTNKEKAFYIINKYISQNKSKYIALLYIRDDGSFRFDDITNYKLDIGE